MKDILKIVVVLILITVLVRKQPVCYFPEEYPELRGATLEDIELRLNKLYTGPLWLFHIGSSMYPTIKDGQACYCEAMEYYTEGDIVSFYRVNDDDSVTFITHRIKEITPYGYITKGDNNDNIDYTSVPAQNVFCKIREKSLLSSIFEGGEQ